MCVIHRKWFFATHSKNFCLDFFCIVGVSSPVFRELFSFSLPFPVDFDSTGSACLISVPFRNNVNILNDQIINRSRLRNFFCNSRHGSLVQFHQKHDCKRTVSDPGKILFCRLLTLRRKRCPLLHRHAEGYCNCNSWFLLDFWFPVVK